TAGGWQSGSRSGATSSARGGRVGPPTAPTPAGRGPPKGGDPKREGAPRREIEAHIKAGRTPGLVATSSLELGIDMGAVALVVLVESPTSVASGLQRVGRAGAPGGGPSKGMG